MTLWKAGKIVFSVLVLLGIFGILIKKGRSLRLWLLLSFFIIGFLRMGEVKREADRQLTFPISGKEVLIFGQIRKIEEKNDSCIVTTVENQLECKGKRYQLNNLIITADEMSAPEFLSGGIKIGMEIAVRGRLQPHGVPRNPGEFHYRNYYRSLKSDYRMYADQITVTKENYIPLFDLMYRLKRKWLKVLNSIAKPEDAGVFAAAILGEKQELDPNIRELYQRNGIAHLLAISGLHVSLIGLCIYRVFRRLGLGYGSAGTLGGVFLIVYGLLTGSSVSVLRAIAMLLSSFLAEYLGRTYDLMSASALAMLLLLIDSPYHLVQSGFQLSFGAVMAIGGLGRWLIQEMTPQFSWQKGLLVSISIQFITYPMILFHFFQYPMYGILLNLIVIPLMAYVVSSGILGIFLGSISVGAGVMAVGSGHYILEFYAKLCRQFERLPGYNLVLGRPEPWQIAFYYSLLLVLYCIWKQVGEKFGKKKRKIFCAALSGTVIVCFFLLWPRPVNGLETVFLDVGQGDGIVLQVGRKAVLVDGGSLSEKKLGRYSLEPFLKSKGISQIEYAIVSHGDYDHISALLYLLEESKDIKIRHLVLPCLGRAEEIQKQLSILTRARGGEVHEMKQGDKIIIDDLELSCIYPGEEDEAYDRNEQSLVIRVNYGNFHMLLTGDMSEVGERNIMESEAREELLGIQVLKVAHHGSDSASGEEFLKLVSPKWGIISYGEGNSFGHPHRAVVDRLNRNHVILWKTPISGAIIMNTDGKRIWWKSIIDRQGI